MYLVKGLPLCVGYGKHFDRAWVHSRNGLNSGMHGCPAGIVPGLIINACLV